MIRNVYKVCQWLFVTNYFIDGWNSFLIKKPNINISNSINVTCCPVNRFNYGLKQIDVKVSNDELLFYQFDEAVFCANKSWDKILAITTKNNLAYVMLIAFYSNAIHKHFIQTHSSLIEYNGYGILFLGPSGIGKTTQAQLWNKYLNALIINGDVAYVEDKLDTFIGWGTPWHGSSPYCVNTSVPLKAIIVLKQGKSNSLRKLVVDEMLELVGPHVFYPNWLENGTELALETLDHILRCVPVYELVNRADEESVMMVKQEVFGNE